VEGRHAIILLEEFVLFELALNSGNFAVARSPVEVRRTINGYRSGLTSAA
jgi:hypothetical protein